MIRNKIYLENKSPNASNIPAVIQMAQAKSEGTKTTFSGTLERILNSAVNPSIISAYSFVFELPGFDSLEPAQFSSSRIHPSFTNLRKLLMRIAADRQLVVPTIAKEDITRDFYIYEIPDFGSEAGSPYLPDFVPLCYTKDGSKISQRDIGILRFYTKKLAFILIPKTIFSDGSNEITIIIDFKTKKNSGIKDNDLKLNIERTDETGRPISFFYEIDTRKTDPSNKSLRIINQFDYQFIDKDGAQADLHMPDFDLILKRKEKDGVKEFAITNSLFQTGIDITKELFDENNALVGRQLYYFSYLTKTYSAANTIWDLSSSSLEGLGSNLSENEDDPLRGNRNDVNRINYDRVKGFNLRISVNPHLALNEGDELYIRPRQNRSNSYYSLIDSKGEVDISSLGFTSPIQFQIFAYKEATSTDNRYELGTKLILGKDFSTKLYTDDQEDSNKTECGCGKIGKILIDRDNERVKSFTHIEIVPQFDNRRILSAAFEVHDNSNNFFDLNSFIYENYLPNYNLDESKVDIEFYKDGKLCGFGIDGNGRTFDPGNYEFISMDAGELVKEEDFSTPNTNNLVTFLEYDKLGIEEIVNDFSNNQDINRVIAGRPDPITQLETHEFFLNDGNYLKGTIKENNYRLKKNEAIIKEIDGKYVVTTSGKKYITNLDSITLPDDPMKKYAGGTTIAYEGLDGPEKFLNKFAIENAEKVKIIEENLAKIRENLLEEFSMIPEDIREKNISTFGNIIPINFSYIVAEFDKKKSGQHYLLDYVIEFIYAKENEDISVYMDGEEERETHYNISTKTLNDKEYLVILPQSMISRTKEEEYEDDSGIFGTASIRFRDVSIAGDENITEIYPSNIYLFK